MDTQELICRLQGCHYLFTEREVTVYFCYVLVKEFAISSVRGMVSFNWGSRSLAGFLCCSAAILPSSDEQWAGGMLAVLLGYNSSAWISVSRSSFCIWTTRRLLSTPLLMCVEMWLDYVLSQLLQSYTLAWRFGQQHLTFCVQFWTALYKCIAE